MRGLSSWVPPKRVHGVRFGLAIAPSGTAGECVDYLSHAAGGAGLPFVLRWEADLIVEWTEPPPMSATAPAPAVLSTDGTLWLAYRIARDPHHCAVVRFHRVEEYSWGAPPAVHVVEVRPELPRGSFYEIPGTALPEAGGRERRWLVTFPDAMLEVRAADAEVVLRATAAISPAHALAALLA